MNELALFAGAGGGLLASRWLLRHRIVCYVERNPYCVEVIKARIADKLLDDAPIWDDVRTFDGQPWAGCVDIVSAGFPCQPFSVAGKQLGPDDERNLWPDTLRIVRKVEPAWIFLENVPTLVTGKHQYFGQILSDLAKSGYDVRWRMLSAAELGAPHQRNRAWIVAHAHSRRRQRTPNPLRSGGQIVELRGETVANAQGQRLQGQRLPGSATQRSCQSRTAENLAHTHGPRSHRPPAKQYEAGRERPERGSWWITEPALGRVAHGVAHRVDRIKALGNG
ncbi:MAG TPA: DNA cytosine methyltransferase, partial [Marinobacter sp.]|nr:DNA cytosine methyltransferase [Marinobacter sp.]